MEFGLHLPNAGPFANGPDILRVARTAAELGFHSVWLFDHFLALYGDPDGPCLEASTLLTALALKTSRVRIGVLVYGNTHRHPAILAKEMVTVDHISGGRATLGIGTGWNEREHAAYAVPFPSAGDRVAMLDEALQVIQLLFTETRTTFEGFTRSPFTCTRPPRTASLAALRALKRRAAQSHLSIRT